jgi:hypothetical protein
MNRRLIPLLAALALVVGLAPPASAGDTTFTLCATNGETDQPASGIEVSVRSDGFLLTLGYTDSNGCFDTDFVYSGDPRNVEFDFTSAHYLPWYGYPTWACEVLYPASPPFVGCTGAVRLVPRIAPSTVGKRRIEAQ